MNVSKALFPVSRGFATIANMQSRMDNLQQQLATGERYSRLSELGSERIYDMTIRARQGKLEAYQSNIQTVDLRLDFLNNVVSRLDEIEADARSTAMTGGSGEGGTGIVTAQSLANARLDEVMTILRTDLNGRFLFGGTTTDSPPVEQASALLDGVGGRDGFRTVTSERKLADAGLDGHGRVVTARAGLTSGAPAVDTVSLTEEDALLNPNRQQITGATTSNAAEITIVGPAGAPVEVTVQFGAGVADGDTVTIDVTQPDGTVEPRVFTAVAGVPANPNEFQIGGTPGATADNFRAALDGNMVANSVTLAEDGAHPFGLKLSTLSTDSDAIAATPPAGGPPASLSMRFTGLPVEGEVVKIGVTLPDGSERTLTFEAKTNAPAADRQFQIGATPEETAANFEAALNTELERFGKTELEAASVYAAANDFFPGQGGTAMRIDGPPFETATAQIAATDADTVIWYSGEDSAGNARQTVQTSVDDGTVVSYGVQANETGIVNLVRSLAVMSIESYPAGDAAAPERYEAMRSRQVKQLSEGNNNQPGSIAVISLDLGIAESTIGQAKARHTTHSGQLDNMLADIEQAPIEEVAMQLLNLQTRLEASYQTTSIISKLSLVNYI